MAVVRDQLFPPKPPGSRFRFSRTGVQPSPGSSTIELPSAFAESGAYPPDRELLGSPRQCSLPLACRQPPEGHQIGARKRRTPENTILSQPYCRRVSTDRPNREGGQLAASLEGEPSPTPARNTLPHSYPETRFRRERARSSTAYNTFRFFFKIRYPDTQMIHTKKQYSTVQYSTNSSVCPTRMSVVCLTPIFSNCGVLFATVKGFVRQ